MDQKTKESPTAAAANVWITVAFCIGVGFGIGGTLLVQGKAETARPSRVPQSRTAQETQRISTVESMKMTSEIQAVAHTKDVARRDALRVALKLRGVTQQELDLIEAKGLKKRGYFGDVTIDQ